MSSSTSSSTSSSKKFRPSYDLTGPPLPSRAGGAQAVAVPALRKVLFVCIGNSCRSQMAEAFARTYGADVMVAKSAGLSPATMISPLTRQMLDERNINIEEHFPKSMEMAQVEPFDILVNISGHPVSPAGAQVIEWAVQDPIGQKEEVYRAVASQLEALVIRLILEMRNGTI